MSLCPPVRKTERSTAGSASRRPNWSVSANPSTTLATSPTCRRVPSARAMSTRFSNSVPQVRLPHGAQPDLAVLALDRSAWKVDGGPPHGADDVVEGQSVTPQRRLRDFDGDLVGTHAGELDLRDFRQAEQLVAHALGDPLEGELVGPSRDRDIDHPNLGPSLVDDRPLGSCRKRLYRVDPGLDVVEYAAAVGVQGDLYDHQAEALVGRGDDLLDAFDALDGFLDADADRRLDLFRRGARIRHLDGQRVERDDGEGLAPHAVHADQAADDDERHQQVRGHRIPSEPLA